MRTRMWDRYTFGICATALADILGNENIDTTAKSLEGTVRTDQLDLGERLKSGIHHLIHLEAAGLNLRWNS
jgi:hypothetical protein